MPADVSKATDELRADVDKLRSDLSEVLSTLRKVAGEGGREGKRVIGEAGARAREQAEESLHAAERQIVERPFTSVLVAFGIGMVIGKLLDRR